MKQDNDFKQQTSPSLAIFASIRVHSWPTFNEQVQQFQCKTLLLGFESLSIFLVYD